MYACMCVCGCYVCFFHTIQYVTNIRYLQMEFPLLVYNKSIYIYMVINVKNKRLVIRFSIN